MDNNDGHLTLTCPYCFVWRIRFHQIGDARSRPGYNCALDKYVNSLETRLDSSPDRDNSSQPAVLQQIRTALRVRSKLHQEIYEANYTGPK